jgi:hypothetical protein
VPIKLYPLVFLSIGIIGLDACSPKSEEVEILKRKKLKNIPGASGISSHGDLHYVIGDNSPYLFVLNNEWEIEQKYEIATPPKDNEFRISKEKKPDFESTSIYNDTLYVLGSGSKRKTRDVLVVFSIENNTTKKYSLTRFYDLIRKNSNRKNPNINIEGTAMNKKHLYLADRETNTILVYDRVEFIAFVMNNSNDIRPICVHKYDLPEIDNVEARFSGLEVSADGRSLYFTASIENEKRRYSQKILGSFIGKIKLTNDLPELHLVSRQLSESHGFLKVESIDFITPNEALFVVDNDSKSSHILRCSIQF